MKKKYSYSVVEVDANRLYLKCTTIQSAEDNLRDFLSAEVRDANYCESQHTHIYIYKSMYIFMFGGILHYSENSSNLFEVLLP